jgi:hypothetical protein
VTTGQGQLICPSGKSAKSCPAPSQKIFRFRRRANQFYQLAPSHPGKRGGSRVVTDAGWDAVDAAALARMESQGGFSRERSTGARTNGASTPRPKTRRTAHGPLRTLAEVAAYGEVVWSWHPLLMSSWRRRSRPNRAQTAIDPLATVTKRNSSPGRARRKPLKPLRGESRVISGVPVVTTVCYYQCTRAAGAPGTRLSLLPPFFEGQCSCRPRAHRAAGMRCHIWSNLCCGTTFETPAAQAPQDEASRLGEVCQTLMVRSAATPRVSNHEAAGSLSETVFASLAMTAKTKLLRRRTYRWPTRRPMQKCDRRIGAEP